MDKPNIVVIDGDPKNLQILRESLESASFQVTTVGNGEEAWTTIKTQKPDIIVSEVDLPGLDGFQLLEKLKSDPVSSAIPIVFLTNRRNLQDRIKSLRTGVKDYMIKPLHVKEVIARLQMILRRIETLRQEDTDTTRKLVGRLEENNVEKLVESYGLERRTGVLAVYDQYNRNGEIYFRDGCVVNARLANFRAEKAVYQMLPWDRGHYIMTLKEVHIDDEITVSNLGLLLQGFKRLQERAKLLEKLPAPETVLVKTSMFDQVLAHKAIGSDALGFISLFDGKRMLSEIMIASTYDDLKTLERITKLYEQGFIQPANGGMSRAAVSRDNPALQRKIERPDFETAAPQEQEKKRGETAPPEMGVLPDKPGSPHTRKPAEYEDAPTISNDDTLPPAGGQTFTDLPEPEDEYETAAMGDKPDPRADEINATSLETNAGTDESAQPEEAQTQEHPGPDDTAGPVFEITEQNNLLEQPFDLSKESERPFLFSDDLGDKTDSPQAADEALPEIEKDEDELQGEVKEGRVPALNGVSDSAGNDSELSHVVPSDESPEPQQPGAPEFRTEQTDATANRSQNGLVTAPEQVANSGLSRLLAALFTKDNITNGHLAVIGGNQSARRELVKALAINGFGTKKLGSLNDEIELGRVKLAGERTVEIMGLSTERRFLQIIDQVSSTLLGYVVLVVGYNTSSLNYLGYLLNSLRNSLKVAHIIAVYQPESQRRIPLDFLRYSLQLDDSEEIVEFRPEDPVSIEYLLKQLQKQHDKQPSRHPDNQIQEGL